MNDILSIAGRLREYATRPDITDLEREDLLTAADAMVHLNGLLNAVEPRSPGATLKRLQG